MYVRSLDGWTSKHRNRSVIATRTKFKKGKQSPKYSMASILRHERADRCALRCGNSVLFEVVRITPKNDLTRSGRRDYSRIPLLRTSSGPRTISVTGGCPL